MTVIYEVNLTIDSDILTEYEAWLSEHVKKMLKIDGFESATIAREYGADDKNCITVYYSVSSKEALQDYFEHHASKMRGDGMQHFQNKFSASRRLLSVEQQFN